MHRALTNLAFSILVSYSSVTFAAQGGNPQAPGNPNIFAAVQALRADLTSGFNNVFQQLQNIQVALQGLIPAVNNVRTTPPLIYGPDGGGFFCSAVNVSSEPKTIRSEAINTLTGQVLQTVEAVVQPNLMVHQGNTAGSQAYYCRFTVLDGTRNDIRADATQTTISGGTSTLRAVVPAE